MKIVEQREDNSEVNMLYSIREFVNSLIPLIVQTITQLDGFIQIMAAFILPVLSLH